MRSLFDSRMGRVARRVGPRSHRGQSGFTLVETIVLIGLITVGLAGVLYLMAVGANLNIDTKDTLASYGAAKARMGEMMQAKRFFRNIATRQFMFSLCTSFNSF